MAASPSTDLAVEEDSDVAVGSAPGRRALLGVALVLLAGQLVFLLANSSHIYGSFVLTPDFASYYQAWFQIAHGHLFPYDTIFGVPFFRNHFELLLWPLSLTYWLWPHGVTLLWLQDLAMVGSEVVVVLWTFDAMDRHPDLTVTSRAVAVVGVVALLVVNPWFYLAASFDFHLEAFATLFAVLAARDLYGGRHRRALWWIGLLLVCGDLGGLYAVGLGISALLSGRSLRRIGALVLGTGLVWVVGLSYAKFNAGSALGDYVQLTAKRGKAAPTITIGDIVTQTLRHPQRLWVLVRHRWRLVIKNLAPSGVIGVFAPWAFGITFVVIGTSIGQDYDGFLQPGFQNLAIYVVVPMGLVLTVGWIARRPYRLGPVTAPMVAAAVGLASLAFGIGYSVTRLPGVLPDLPQLSPAQIDVLSRTLASTPASAQVVTSYGVVGRFAGRPWTYYVQSPTLVPNALIPVRSRLVVFVVVADWGFVVSPVQAASDVAQIESLGARVVTRQDGITVLRWVPPPHEPTLDLGFGRWATVPLPHP